MREQVRTGEYRTRHDRKEQDRTAQDRTEQNMREQDRTGENRTGQRHLLVWLNVLQVIVSTRCVFDPCNSA